ncbi:MAG: AAA family ATPase [Acidobacteria bacterium]|nr:AAA family ATPase [Acidobacteriota bacterium]
MPTRRKSIYFLSLELENVRCFAEEQELRLVDSNGRPARWTLLVGDNGVGKTTLLQCLAWMRPTPYYPPGKDEQKGIQPLLHDQYPPVMANLFRDGAGITTLRAEMVQISSLTSQLPRTARVRTGIEVLAKNNKFDGANRTVNEPQKAVDPFIITYGANRHMGHQNAGESPESGSVDLLQTDDTELVDAAEVLSDLDYSAYKKRPKARARLEKMKHALAEILPFIAKSDDIEILGPQQPGGSDESGGLRFRTPYGRVPLEGLSLGHRTVTAWIVDLAWRLIVRYPESAKPLEEPAVVLIDEIDLHLHPHWQRRIMKQLSEHFPNVQFVATTHSPLMITSLDEVNVAVLRQVDDGDHVVIKTGPTVVEGWRFDQILVNLFGLESARSLRVEELMKERERLLGKKRRTPRDREQLQHIADELSSLPTAERREDQDAMDFVRRAAAAFRARQEEQK